MFAWGRKDKVQHQPGKSKRNSMNLFPKHLFVWMVTEMKSLLNREYLPVTGKMAHWLRT